MWLVNVIEDRLVQAFLLIGGAAFLMWLERMRHKTIEWIKRQRFGLSAAVKKSKRSTEILMRTRLSLNAGRAFTARFHNGEFFGPSTSVWKVTRVNENAAEGVMSILTTHHGDRRINVENVLVERVWEEIEPFYEEPSTSGISVEKDGNGRPLVYIVRNELPNCWLKQLLQAQGVEARALSPICRKTRKKKTDQCYTNIVGMMGVDWIDSKYTDRENKPDLTPLAEAAPQMEFLLDNKEC